MLSKQGAVRWSISKDTCVYAYTHMRAHARTQYVTFAMVDRMLSHSHMISSESVELTEGGIKKTATTITK